MQTPTTNAPGATLAPFTTETLQAEIDRRALVADSIQWRIYTGELEVTDADGVTTMAALA